MNPCETAGSSPDAQERKKTRQHWPIEVKNGSVTAKIYRSKALGADGLPKFYSVAYYLPSGRKVDQRGSLEKAKEHARLMVDSIAAGEVDAAEMSKHDRMELLALRERAAAHGMQPLLAMEEWAKARSLVGPEIITACEKWKNRLTQFTRLSVIEAVKRFKASYVKKRRSRVPKGLREEEVEKLIVPKSYRHAFSQLEAKFGERYLDDLKKDELEEWFLSKAKDSGWTGNTYRKRVVTLFRWARNAGFLPRDQVTDAEMTEKAEEVAPKRELTVPETLARILYLFQFGRDLEDTEKQFDPRPELVPAVVLSAFSGYRSCEGHVQNWEDLDMLDLSGNVTKAKRGTAADRATTLPHCAIEWLKLTPATERIGAIHSYKTEIHTILRKHLRSTIDLQLPENTFRKSWESYRVVIDKDDGQVAAEEAGHSVHVSQKHYRNARAKKSAARAWFMITPDLLQAFYAHRKAQPKTAGSVREMLDRQVARHMETYKRALPQFLASMQPLTAPVGTTPTPPPIPMAPPAVSSSDIDPDSARMIAQIRSAHGMSAEEKAAWIDSYLAGRKAS